MRDQLCANPLCCAERERAAAGIEEEERPTDQAGYQELVERKIQAGIAQGQFDTKRLKYAGVDLLAASRGQGGEICQQCICISVCTHGVGYLPNLANVVRLGLADHCGA